MSIVVINLSELVDRSNFWGTLSFTRNIDI